MFALLSKTNCDIEIKTKIETIGFKTKGSHFKVKNEIAVFLFVFLNKGMSFFFQLSLTRPLTIVNDQKDIRTN